MDPDSLAKLNQLYPALIQDMDAMPAVDNLVAASIFNDYHRKEIQKQQESEDKNRRLLDILKTKGVEALHQFIAALRATNQHSLVTLLDGRFHTDDLQQIQNLTQESLKQNYLLKFRHVYPFSLPFTFDIESTWVSLALKEDLKDSEPIEDHAKLLERAFEKVKMIIIEGDPATGKTSLMRRLAYEWAKGRKELLHYNLVVYAEFREVREQTFENIADLVLYYSKKYLKEEDFQRLALRIKNEEFCKMNPILILLDGYDESSLEKQCSELHTFLSSKTIDKPLLFNIVITTRKGYLSKHRGFRGRFIYAEVLGFITAEQKKTYIDTHFSSVENVGENIKAVHHLLEKNKSLDKLAESPLFLTFICLVHENIIDGTLVELYCNSIRWLIDRHQQDFPDRDIPALFEFKSDPDDRFRTIQDHYLEFPQLRCLGKMALTKLKQNIFQQSDLNQFDMKSIPINESKRTILEYVGLLRKDELYKSLKLTTTFSFPHRTIQEFLAAFYYFISQENSDQTFPLQAELDTYRMKEYEKFLFRIALSKQMPINTTKRKIYFEGITKLTLDLTFDAINTTIGLNNELLNWFIAQCTNIRILQFNKESYEEKEPQTSVHILLTLTNLNDVVSLRFNNCIIQGDSQISFTNCPSLKALAFYGCEITHCTRFDLSKLPPLDILKFYECAFLVNSQISFTKDSSLKNLEFIRCEIKSNSSIDFSKLAALDNLKFDQSIFEANSQISFTNCASLQYLEFNRCDIKNSVSTDFSQLPALDTLKFDECTIEANSRISFTNCASLKYLGFKRCDIKNSVSTDFSQLPALDTLRFDGSTIEANSRISFTNCPSLKHLGFYDCEIRSSARIDFSQLPALDALEFRYCAIDSKAWQFITDEITRSSVKRLKLSSDFFEKAENSELVIHLQKCECIEKTEIYILHGMLNEEQLITNLSNLAREMNGLKKITFDDQRKRMKEENMKIIENAGQERNPDFKIGSDRETREGLEPAKGDADTSLEPRSTTKTDKVEGILPSTLNTPLYRELEEMEITEHSGPDSDPDFGTIFSKETEEDCDPLGKDEEVNRIKLAESKKRKGQASSSTRKRSKIINETYSQEGYYQTLHNEGGMNK